MANLQDAATCAVHATQKQLAQASATAAMCHPHRHVTVVMHSSLCTQGSLAQLDTKTPVMYVDFPAGRLKLFGTLCFPKAKYLALRFGPKEVLCEDVFESMARLLARRC